MLISAAALVRLVGTGQKLRVKKRRIHALALRRLMCLEAKFLGRAAESLKHGPLYARFIAREDFDVLFRDSADAGEDMPGCAAGPRRAGWVAPPRAARPAEAPGRGL
jgi:hypothetical protein